MKTRALVAAVLGVPLLATCGGPTTDGGARQPALPTPAAGAADPVEPAQTERPERTSVTVDGVSLEVRDTGEGPAVLFVHGSVFRDSLLPLADQPAFTEHYRVIYYARRGFGNNPSAPISMEVQADDAAAVLTHLGVDKAHVVGHSFGANIAMQMAVSHREMVASLSLLEPILPLDVPSGQASGKAMAPMFEAYAKGDKEGAMTMFLTAMAGPNYREFIDKVFPKGAHDLALADIDTLFQSEFPALNNWHFGAEKAYEGTTGPVMWLSGGQSLPMFREGGDVLAGWYPQLVRQEISEGGHSFPATHAAETAGHLTRFLAGQTQP